MLGRISDKNIGHKIGQIQRTKNRTNISDKNIPQKIGQKIGQTFWTKSRTKKSDKNWTKTQTKNRINVPTISRTKKSNKYVGRVGQKLEQTVGRKVGQNNRTKISNQKSDKKIKKKLDKYIGKSSDKKSDKLINSYFEKVHATIPKGIVSGFEFTVVQRNLKEWHERS